MTVSIANMSQVWMSNTNTYNAIVMSVSTLGYGANTNSNLLTLKIDGNTRFNVDATGRLLVPNQIAFHAHGTTGNYTLTNGADIPFDSVAYNTGSGYNTSTYRFTAPIAGNYYFSYSLFVNGGSGRVSFKRNNTDYYGNQTNVNATTGFTGHNSCSIIMRLNVGDYVSVGDYQSISGGVFYMGHSFFSGRLLG